MVSSANTPPEKKAMTDQELNQAVASLQIQPNGLIEAMALIESQTQLREQDAKDFLIWESENRLAVAEQQRLQAEEAQRQAQAQEAKRVAAELEAKMLAERLVVQRLADEEAARVASQQAEVQRLADEEAARVASQQAEVQRLAEVEASEGAAKQELEAQRLVEENSLVEAALVENVPPLNSDPVAFLNASYAQVASEQVIDEEAAEIATEILAEEGVDLSSESPVNQDFMDMVFADADAENQIPMVAVAVADGNLATEQKQEKPEPPSRTSGLVWSWLSVAASPLILLFVAQLKVAGASYTQAIVLLSAVIIVSAAMAAFGAVSSKRAGSSVVFLSRAAFGVWGNIVPASFVLAVKLFWLAAFAILSAKIISPLVFSQSWFDSISRLVPMVPVELLTVLVVLVPLFSVAAVIAGFGGYVMLRTQQVAALVSIVGLVVVAAFVISSFSVSNFAVDSQLPALNLIDLTLLGIVTFAYPAFTVSGDFARKLPGDLPGPKVFFLSFISLLIAPLAIAALGVSWFYLESEGFAQIVLDETLSGVATSSPIWAFVAFTVAIGISILQLTSSLLYTGVQSLKSIGVNLHPSLNQLILTVLSVGAALLVSSFVLANNQGALVASLLLTVSCLMASWIGIVLADALLRRVGYHEVSLTRSYGFYGRFNVVNFVGFIVAAVVGLGYVSNDGPLTFWQGYLLNLTPELSQFTGNYIGIVMAFGIALLFPVVAGIPRIRKQEHALLELESRRQELRQFLDTVE